MELLDALKSFEELKNVPDNQLNWLIEKGEVKDVPVGDRMFSAGDPIDKMYIVLKGSFVIRVKRNNQFQELTRVKQGSITGLLPYSRAQTAVGYGEAVVDSKVLILYKELIQPMIKECHELTTALVHVMSSRIKQFTRQEQMDDKMMALGKLSAGLAHELNNPSAAVVRSSQALSKQLKQQPDYFKRIIKIKMTDEQVDLVNDLLFAKVSAGTPELTLMEKSEQEDELMDWLDDHEIDDSDELASNFVEYGLTVDDLDTIEDASDDHLASVIGWLNQVLTTERLVNEIEDASQRINDLVKSVKGYTHMDQAPEKVATDIHIGLNSTLTMLNHKLKSIEVVKDYEADLPLPQILTSPMNQVWTNIIDNAIDAMESQETKQLTVSTKKDGDFINVMIQDSGTGIPEEVQSKIFDPFFTTKEIGKGTGMGLEFVHQIIKNQHYGAIYLESKPGKTIFTICIPIKAA